MLMDKPLISPKRQASPTEEMYSRPESPVPEEVAEEQEPDKVKPVARYTSRHAQASPLRVYAKQVT
jgi:hypothetical protein